MVIASSKLTAQGQISVPAQVRRKLGLAAGSVIEWEERGDVVLVRRADDYNSSDLHAALFGDQPAPVKTLAQLKAGVRTAVKKRHARG